MLKLDVLIASVIALVAGVIFYPFAAIGVDPHHDGIMLKPALDVLSGQVLFSDTFSQYGPLTTYIQALALKVNPTLLSVRLLSVVAYAGSLGLLYLAWRVLLPRLIGLTAVLLFLISIPFFRFEWPLIPWSSTLALFFQSLALLAFMRLVAGDRAVVWAWVLGVACACTLGCRQTVGIILVGSVGVTAAALHLTGWRSKYCSAFRIWTRVTVGFGVIVLLVLANLAMNGALSAWWEQNIVWPGRWVSGQAGNRFSLYVSSLFLRKEVLVVIGVLVIGLAPGLIRRFYVKLPLVVDLVWWGILAVFYITLARAWVRPSLLIESGGWRAVILSVIVLQSVIVVAQARVLAVGTGLRREYYLIAVLCGLSLGSAAQVYPVACLNHIFWALAPGFGVFVWFLYKNIKVSPGLFALSFLLLFAAPAYEKYRWAMYNLEMPRVELAQPAVLRGMRVDAETAAAFDRVQSIVGGLLARDPDQAAILYGDDAMYPVWFNNRYNPSPYYVTWSDLLTQAEASKRMNYVVMKRPVLLLHGPSVAQLIVIPEDYALLINEPLLDLRIMASRHFLNSARSNLDPAQPIR